MANPVSCSICWDFHKEAPTIAVVHKPSPFLARTQAAAEHAFHESCFKAWIEQGKNTCPDCKQVVTHFNGQEVAPPPPPQDESYFLSSVRSQEGETVSFLLPGISPDDLNRAVLICAEVGSVPILRILLTRQILPETLKDAVQLAKDHANGEAVKILQETLGLRANRQNPPQVPSVVIDILTGNGARRPVTPDSLCLALKEADTVNRARYLLLNKNILDSDHWKQAIGAALTARREEVAKLMIRESGNKIRDIDLRILSRLARTNGFPNTSQMLNGKMSWRSRISQRLGCPIG